MWRELELFQSIFVKIITNIQAVEAVLLLSLSLWADLQTLAGPQLLQETGLARRPHKYLNNTCYSLGSEKFFCFKFLGVKDYVEDYYLKGEKENLSYFFIKT